MIVRRKQDVDLLSHSTPNIARVSKFKHNTNLDRGIIGDSGDPAIRIEHIKKYAERKSGKCLSHKYDGPNDILFWACKFGHTWNATLNQVHGGYWCPKCRTTSKSNANRITNDFAPSKPILSDSPKTEPPKTVSKPLPPISKIGSFKRVMTIDTMRALAATYGGKCLSLEYLGAKIKLSWECKFGHRFEKAPNEVKYHHSWCKICNTTMPKSIHSSKKGESQKSNPRPAPANKFTIKDMTQLARERNGKCLSDTYINSETKLEWECEFGHHFEASCRQVKHKKVWCPTCNQMKINKPSSTQIILNANSVTATESTSPHHDIIGTTSAQAVRNVKAKISRMKKIIESPTPANPSSSSIFTPPDAPLFEGAKFPLYAFDVNNLVSSFKERSSNYLSHLSPLPEIRKKCMDSQPYLAYWFASKNFAWSIAEIPNDEHNRRYIESRFKDKTAKKYIDIDIALAVIISPILDMYHNQISAFYLGSGDKDLAILLEKASAYGIPCYVVGIDMKTVAQDLVTFSNGTVTIF